MHESDGIDEILDGQLRTLVTVATMVGQAAAQVHQRRQQEAARRSDEDAQRYAAELAAARGQAEPLLAQVGREAWWKDASAEQIAQVWEVACAWSQLDPAAAQVQATILEQLAERGVSIDAAAPADAAQLRALVRERLDELAAAEAEATRAERERLAGDNELGLALDDLAEITEALARGDLDGAAQLMDRMESHVTAGNELLGSAQDSESRAAVLAAGGADAEIVAVGATVDAGFPETAGDALAAAVDGRTRAPKARSARRQRQRDQSLSR